MEPKLEYIDTLQEAVMVRLFEQTNGVAVGWHNHKEMELVFIKKGAGNCMVGDKIVEYQSGDFFLLGSNVPHLFKSFDTESEDERYIFQCSEKLFKGELFELEALSILRNYINKLSFGKLLNAEESISYESTIDAIYKASSHKAIFQLYQLLIDLAEANTGVQLSSLPYSNTDNKNTRTGKILTYILENISTELTVDNVSDYMNMSKPALCNYFKKTTGKRFSEFVNEVRINKACQILKSTDMSIAEISYAVGYSNLSYFNRSFQKLKELSPKQYRNLGNN